MESYITKMRAETSSSTLTGQSRCALSMSRKLTGPDVQVTTIPSRLGFRLEPDDNESVAGSLAFHAGLPWHHAAVVYDDETALRLTCTGAFEITFPDENVPDIKDIAVARSLVETPIRSRLSSFQ